MISILTKKKLWLWVFPKSSNYSTDTPYSSTMILLKYRLFERTYKLEWKGTQCIWYYLKLFLFLLYVRLHSPQSLSEQTNEVNRYVIHALNEGTRKDLKTTCRGPWIRVCTWAAHTNSEAKLSWQDVSHVLYHALSIQRIIGIFLQG